MFRKWLAIFKKDTLMDQAYQQSFEMLDITLEMFQKAKKSLRFTEDSEVDLNVRDMDLKVNKYEREVRRMVFRHLVVSGAETLPSGLALISIIIDIERLGDYAKNMVDLAVNHPGKLSGGKFEQEFCRIEEAVANNFVKTRKFFETGISEPARELLKEYNWVNPACDRVMFDLLSEKDKDIRPRDAIALSLYIRWLKRINSHLRNITTSVVNPFDRIGFEPKD
ncbi:MAG: PhoU domain-containing protein [Candidatus Aminicenantes bacterium]|nr:PhoU domain-containing protein [Candidatus Aminicenantes bacterium]